MQKLTLLDYPDEVACIVFTRGCNFACPFCHNSELIGGGACTDESEVLSYLKKRSGILDGVVITGGEPLMQADIKEFTEKIRDIGYKIKLDTNGSFPDRLGELIDRGLVNYVAMDIKSSPAGYAAAAGRSIDMHAIDESVAIIKAAGIDREFRTTAVKGIHYKEDITAAAKYLGTDIPYYLQNYRASDTVLSPAGLSEFSAEEMEEMRLAASEYCPNTNLR